MDRGLILETDVFCRLKADKLEDEQIKNIITSQMTRRFYVIKDEQLDPSIENQIGLGEQVFS